MNRRDAFFSDEAAIAELFGRRSSVAEAIMSRYVRPRHTKNKIAKIRDNRNHFTTASLPGRANEPGITEAQRVEAKLAALSSAPNKYVGKAVASVYCEISEHQFDLRRKDMRKRKGKRRGAKKITVDERVKRERPKDANGNFISGARAKVSFRMDLVEEIKAHRIPSTAKAATAPMVAKPFKVSGTLSQDANGKVVITLDDASRKKMLWMVTRERKVFAHMAFNAQSPGDIAAFFAGGGTIERMTIQEALSERTWINLDERRGWAAGYTRLLTEEIGAVARRTLESDLEADMPPSVPKVGKRPFAVAVVDE